MLALVYLIEVEVRKADVFLFSHSGLIVKQQFVYFYFFYSFTWVINPSLNNIIQSKSTGCLFGPQLLVHGRSQDLGHVIVVFAEVRVLLLRGVFQLRLVVRVSERHGCSLGG